MFVDMAHIDGSTILFPALNKYFSFHERHENQNELNHAVALFLQKILIIGLLET